MPSVKAAELATWPCMGLGKITKPKDIKSVRQWLEENTEDDYVVRLIKETRGKRRVTIATFIRFRSQADATLFKLTWHDYE